jgi:hypothetical protein
MNLESKTYLSLEPCVKLLKLSYIKWSWNQLQCLGVDMNYYWTGYEKTVCMGEEDINKVVRTSSRARDMENKNYWGTDGDI